MGLLAFDRPRLDRLRTAIGAALDDLHGVRSDDAAAAEAMLAVGSACRTLGDVYLPRVQDILSSDAMTSYRPATVDGDDIRQALVYMMSKDYAWEVAGDPADDNSFVVTTQEAAALGRRLQSGNLNTLIDHPLEADFIARELTAIAADPPLRAEFLANMTHLDTLADDYATARLELVTRQQWNGDDPATTSTLQSIDATFAALTALYQSDPSTSHASPYPAWVAGVEPFTAALLLRYARLDATTLGHVSNDLLVRWHFTRPDDEGRDQISWSDLAHGGPNTADFLFQSMLAAPGACTAYVIDAKAAPLSLWFGAHDYRLAQQVAIEGTDPANIAPAAAGEVIKSFIDFSRSERLRYSNDLAEGYPTDYTTFLGSLVAPWLVQFSPLNTEWNIDYTSKDKLLETVLHDHGALDALIGSQRAVVDGLRSSEPTGEAPTYATAEHAALIGMLGQLIVKQRVRNEQQRLDAWNMWWDVASLPTAWLPPIGAIIAGRVIIAAHDTIEQHGWLAVPRPAKAHNDGKYELEWMLTAAGAGMAIAAFGQLGFPPGTPPPPEPDPTVEHPTTQYQVDLIAWEKEVDDPLTADVAAWAAPFMSAADAGKSLAG